jgi:hypothetical protein
VTYAAEQILDEVAYVAAVYHWSLDSLLDLEHPDRAHFVAAARRLTGEE